MMHMEKGNFKRTIVGFVPTEQREMQPGGHFNTIHTKLVGVRASLKQKMSKASFHFSASLNSPSLAARGETPALQRQVIIKLGLTQHKQTHSGLVEPLL